MPLLITATLFPLKSTVAAPKTVTLNYLAANSQLISVSQTDKKIIWKTEKSKMAFYTGSRRILFNDKIFWLNSPISRNGKNWIVSYTDAETIITPLLHPEKVPKNKTSNTVMLDPGHGGKDSGGIGCHNTYEKTVVLDIARRVQRKLKASNVIVYMTRNSDIFLELYQRPRLATRKKADLFISIHANKAGRSGANGIETFVMPAAGFPSTTSSKANKKSYPGNRNNTANTILASMIHTELINKTSATDRGVKRARFKVLKDATCPATLVEVGFLTNPTEATNLITPSYREKIADGIANGILNYLARSE